MRRFLAAILTLLGAAQVQADQRTDKIIIEGNPAGEQTVQVEAGGVVRAECSYNDREAGAAITSSRSGSSMPMACRSSTKRAGLIT